MYAIAEFTVIPIGTEVSLAKYVAACQRVLEKTGLTYEMHANGTDLEGEWEQVMQAIKTCHQRLHEMGVPRISTILKIGTRTDRAQTMAEKIADVRAELQK